MARRASRVGLRARVWEWFLLVLWLLCEGFFWRHQNVVDRHLYAVCIGIGMIWYVSGLTLRVGSEDAFCLHTFPNKGRYLSSGSRSVPSRSQPTGVSSCTTGFSVTPSRTAGRSSWRPVLRSFSRSMQVFLGCPSFYASTVSSTSSFAM